MTMRTLEVSSVRVRCLLQIRQKYESMLNGDEEHDRHLKLQLLNFDEAMIHPTKEDLEHATTFAKNCLSRL